VTTHAAVILLALLSCLTTAMGVALAIALREHTRAIAVGIGFSAGMMIMVAALDLVPQSILAMGATLTVVSALLGAGLGLAANLTIPHTHLFEEAGARNRRQIKSAYLVAFGLILHDVPEGFAMANAYVASPGHGVLVALAIALHNLPEELAMSVPVMLVRRRRVLFSVAALSALAEPLGAIIGLAAVGFAPFLNAHFMAVAAGAMLFVSIHELLPMARRYRHIALFLGGVSLSVVVYGLLASVILGV
jgi:ZIP family zinc transporter